MDGNKKIFFSVIVAIALIISSYRVGFTNGQKGVIFDTKTFKVVNQVDQPTTVDYNLLWDTLKVVQQKYIERDQINQQKVLYGAIRGAVAAAGDQYTTFFDPAELNSFKTELKGSFDGIGAEVGKKDNSIVIIAPLDGTPAQRAGLKAADIIVSIDGQSTADMSVDDAVNKIRGKKGTAVTLSIYRRGADKPFEVKITRDTIAVKSVKVTYKEVNGKKIAVLTLAKFGDDTKELFDKAVIDITAQKADGIVLDLRNNPGGYLESAVDTASNWIEKNKVVVTEAHSATESVPYNSYGYGKLSKIKTVALINAGSASAAEILAGALHDYNIAKLIGVKSFGKGSVQELVDLPGGSALKVTVAKWITPGGKNLNKDGLNPDIEVKLSDDDIAKNKDPQMDAAVNEVVK